MTTMVLLSQVLADKLAAIRVLPIELARQICAHSNRIAQIIQGKRGITGDSALRLEHWFGDAPEFWMCLHAQHELREVAQEVGGETRLFPRHPALANVR